MTLDNITVNVQSSIRIETSLGVVYFDPIEMEKPVADARVIFITHDHFDHFSPESIAMIANDDTIMVVPEKMIEEAVAKTKIDRSHIVPVKPGDVFQTAGILAEAVAAYNNIKPFHPKSAGWCGYVIEADGVRYYVAGDTNKNEENREVRCDVALVPVGGTYTMDEKSAAEFVNQLRPKAAIPTHYGSLAGKPEDGLLFKAYVSSGIEVELKLPSEK